MVSDDEELEYLLIVSYLILPYGDYSLLAYVTARVVYLQSFRSYGSTSAFTIASVDPGIYIFT